MRSAVQCANATHWASWADEVKIVWFRATKRFDREFFGGDRVGVNANSLQHARRWKVPNWFQVTRRHRRLSETRRDALLSCQRSAPRQHALSTTAGWVWRTLSKVWPT